MIAKRNTAYSSYCQVVRLSDGKIAKFNDHRSIDLALMGGDLTNVYEDLDDLKELKDCQLLPPSLETMSVGDEVGRRENEVRRVLTAQGVGEYRTYILSELCNHKVSNLHATAYDLSKAGYKPLPWPEQEESSRTVDDVLEGLPEKDKEIIRKRLK